LPAYPLRRALLWWFAFWAGPSGRAAAVWLAWAGLTAATVGFIRRYGQDIPSWEEWVFLPGLLGERSRWGWVFERLQEHRYPLGRAVSLLLFDLGGWDFRVGMYASGLLLSAAAAVLLRAVAVVRGHNDHPDLLIPVLVLNPGGYENLTLSYQLPFAVNVLLAAILVRSAASPSAAGWRLTADTTLVALLALGGWVGLAFVPGGLVWIAARAWGRYRRDGSLGRLLGVIALPAAAAGYFVWCYLEVQRNPLPGAAANNPATAARVFAEFLSGAVGTPAQGWWPWSGVFGVGLFAVVGTVLARDLLTRPDRRSTAAGCLVVLSALALMGYGLAQRRPNGFAVRNLPFVALLSVVAHLVVVRWASRRPAAVRIGGTLVVVPLAVFVYWHGWRTGADGAGPHWGRNVRFEQDRPTGLPLNFLASRHQLFPFPGFADSLRLLRDRGHPAAAGIPDPPELRAEPLPVPPPTAEQIPGDPPTAVVRGRPRVWKIDLGGERAVAGVRVRLEYHVPFHSVPLQVVWTRPGGGVRTAECRPWLIPYTWDLDFRVDDRATAVWFRCLEEEKDRFDLRGVQLLLPPR
jgi:hypothetical protein